MYKEYHNNHYSLYPRYGHNLVMSPGKTFIKATDKPPVHLKQFWPGDTFYMRQEDGALRLDSYSVNSLAGYQVDGEFCTIKFNEVFDSKLTITGVLK